MKTKWKKKQENKRRTKDSLEVLALTISCVKLLSPRLLNAIMPKRYSVPSASPPSVNAVTLVG